MEPLQQPLGPNHQDAETRAFRTARSLLQLFRLDVLRLPLEKFSSGGSFTNLAGAHYTHYELSIPEKECGLFDVLEITYFSDKDYNLHFKGGNLNDESMQHLEILVNRLYGIYDVDDLENGRWIPEEGYSLLHHRYWTGRSWCNAEVFPDKPLVSLHYNREGEFLALTLFDIQRLALLA